MNTTGSLTALEHQAVSYITIRTALHACDGGSKQHADELRTTGVHRVNCIGGLLLTLSLPSGPGRTRCCIPGGLLRPLVAR